MSATDILNQLKTLSPNEQAAFERLFRQWQSVHSPVKPATQTRSWPDFITRLRNIYGNKITSDSQSLINELRGDR
jgi:hypothetical protein